MVTSMPTRGGYEYARMLTHMIEHGAFLSMHTQWLRVRPHAVVTSMPARSGYDYTQHAVLTSMPVWLRVCRRQIGDGDERVQKIGYRARARVCVCLSVTQCQVSA